MKIYQLEDKRPGNAKSSIRINAYSPMQAVKEYMAVELSSNQEVYRVYEGPIKVEGMYGRRYYYAIRKKT